MTDQQKTDLDHAELLANLRKIEWSGQTSNAITHWQRNPEGPEAADLIERLRAERDEAVALLRLFDMHLSDDDAMWSDCSTVSSEWIRSDGIRQSLTFGLFRQVRTFLQSIARETGK